MNLGGALPSSIEMKGIPAEGGKLLSVYFVLKVSGTQFRTFCWFTNLRGRGIWSRSILAFEVCGTKDLIEMLTLTILSLLIYCGRHGGGLRFREQIVVTLLLIYIAIILMIVVVRRTLLRRVEALVGHLVIFKGEYAYSWIYSP